MDTRFIAPADNRFKIGYTIWLRIEGETGKWPVDFEIKAEGIIAGEDGMIYEDKIKAMIKAIRQPVTIDLFTHDPHTWERRYLANARTQTDEGPNVWRLCRTQYDGRAQRGTEAVVTAPVAEVVRQLMALHDDLARAVRVQAARQKAYRLERAASRLVSEALYA